MVSCKQCNTPNSLDSTFCKRCGATLEADDIAIATEKLSAMIADGNKLFADGRTEEAMMVAETAVANNPSSAAAISLKGMCHERKGQIAEALECFEKVVELNPDSTLDKIKANDLRNLLVAKKMEAPKPSRSVALVTAVAATALVIAGGAIVAKAVAAKGGPTEKQQLVAQNTTDPNTRTFGDLLNSNANAANPNTQANPSQGNQGSQGNVQQTNTNGDENTDSGTTYRQPRHIDLPDDPGNRLPRPEEGFDGKGTIPPVTVTGPIGLGGGQQTGGPNEGPKTKLPDDPPPGPMSPTGQEEPAKPKTPTNDPGIIEINVSKGTKPSVGGGSSAPTTGNGREALLQAARSQMLSGNYQGAANSYERALRSGADPSSTYQRLGQCYEQIGRNREAISAYQRAADAIQTAIDGGTGDKAALQNRLDSCRQAIKVLGG